MKTQTALGWILTNQEAVLSWVALILFTLFNVLARKKKPEEWEMWAMSKPALAFLIEFSRGFGIDPFAIVRAARRWSDRSKGQIPEDAIRMNMLPDSVKQLLLRPNGMVLLQRLAEMALDDTPTGSTPPSAPSQSPAPRGPATGLPAAPAPIEPQK